MGVLNDARDVVDSGEAKLMNISTSGAGLVGLRLTKNTWVLEATHIIKLHVPTDELGEKTLLAEHVRIERRNKEWLHGIRFVDIDSTTIQSLETLTRRTKRTRHRRAGDEGGGRQAGV